MQVVDATCIPQAYLGLEEGHDVGVAQRAQYPGRHTHCQGATWRHHHVCCRANGDSACQRGVLDVHLHMKRLVMTTL